MGKISELTARVSQRVLVESAFIFVGLISFGSATVAFMPQRQWSWPQSLTVFAGAAAIAVGYAVARTRPKQLPEDLLPDEDGRCSIAVTTDAKVVRSVNQLAKVVYPGVPPLNAKLYMDWLAVNPNILVCLHDGKLRLQGYFDVFPLKEPFLDELIRGTYDEQDIRTEHILAPADAEVAPRLYLAGIAVREAKTTAGNWHGAMLLTGLTRYFKKFYGAPNDKEIVAVAATEFGERMLGKLGFQVCVNGDHRKDGKTCYKRRMDAELFKRLSPTAERDWSGTCTFGF